MRQSSMGPNGLLPRTTFVGLLWMTWASANLICFKGDLSDVASRAILIRMGKKILDSSFRSIYNIVRQNSTFESLKNSRERCHFMLGSLAVSVTSWTRLARFTSVLLHHEPTFFSNMTASRSTQIRIKKKKRRGEEGKDLWCTNRPTDRTTIRSMHTEIFVHFLRFRPTFVLVFLRFVP